MKTLSFFDFSFWEIKIEKWKYFCFSFFVCEIKNEKRKHFCFSFWFLRNQKRKMKTLSFFVLVFKKSKTKNENTFVFHFGFYEIKNEKWKHFRFLFFVFDISKRKTNGRRYTRTFEDIAKCFEKLHLHINNAVKILKTKQTETGSTHRKSQWIHELWNSCNSQHTHSKSREFDRKGTNWTVEVRTTGGMLLSKE